MAVGSLRLLPAVDVANGLAVTHRTSAGGDAGAGISALDACLRWVVEAGADWIHLVDLDAAFGRGSNAPLLAQVIADLARLHPGVSVQWSGGVNSADDVERALSAGAKRVNLGAGALKDLAATTALVGRFGRHLNVCLDVSAASAAPSPAAPADPAPSGAVFFIPSAIFTPALAHMWLLTGCATAPYQGPTCRCWGRLAAPLVRR